MKNTKKEKKCDGHTFVCKGNRRVEKKALNLNDDEHCDICGGLVRVNRGGWVQQVSDPSCKQVK